MKIEIDWKDLVDVEVVKRKRPGIVQVERKKSEKKCTKDVDDARIRPHTLRMKTGIDWNDLVDVKVDGGTSTVAFVTSAYHREWKRYLTEDECDAVTAKYGAKIYEMEFDKKY